MQNRELSQKHQSSVYGVKGNTALLGRNAASKKSSRSEVNSVSILLDMIMSRHLS